MPLERGTRQGSIVFENGPRAFFFLVGSRHDERLVLTEWLYTTAHRRQEEPDGHCDFSAGVWR